jgi:hypothetical protein
MPMRPAGHLPIAGCRTAHDLTPEAALTKLMFLRSSGMSCDRIGTEIARPLAGELTAG